MTIDATPVRRAESAPRSSYASCTSSLSRVSSIDAFSKLDATKRSAGSSIPDLAHKTSRTLRQRASHSCLKAAKYTRTQLDQVGRLRQCSLHNADHVDRLVDAVVIGLSLVAFPLTFVVPPVGLLLVVITSSLHLGTHAKDLLAPVLGSPESTLFRRALLLAEISTLSYAALGLLAGGLSNPIGLALFIAGHAAIVLALSALVWKNRHAGSLPKVVRATCKDSVRLAFH